MRVAFRLWGITLAALVVLGCGVVEPSLPSVPLPFEMAQGTPTAGGVTFMLSVAAVDHSIPAYDRSEWRVWQDVDGDCQNTRHEALIAESLAAVSYANSDGCRVVGGEWFGVYTGRRFGDASELDVDHMVPLANAHRSGGWRWSGRRKAEFGNDLSYANHLIAVESGANRRKRDSGPEDWKPPRRGYWCQYAIDWATIKERWGLTATLREVDALREMLGECDNPPLLLTIGGGGDVRQDAVEMPPSSSGDGLLYDPWGADRDCGDFGTWEEAQDFYEAAGGPDDDPHRLDGDRDGIACAGLR